MKELNANKPYKEENIDELMFTLQSNTVEYLPGADCP